MSDEISAAAQALEAGCAVIFPTDTVYGLGVSVKHAASPLILFDIKHRPDNKPVAWLVGGAEALDTYGTNVPEQARELARKHWPGALTIIVKASEAVPTPFRSAAGTIGLRMPANETALTLIQLTGSPLATTSANRSGGPDPRRADDLDAELVSEVCAVVRKDPAQPGVPSTVIDCSTGNITIVRQGAIMIDTVFTVPFDFASHDGESTVNAKVWTNVEFGIDTHAEPCEPPTEENFEKPPVEHSEGLAVKSSNEPSKPKGIIQIVHGMSEHIDRYDGFARFLVKQGFVVCAEDHIGHGGTASTAEEFGHMPVHGGKDILLRDVHTVRRMVSTCFPETPYILYGHSMGSFIARAYIARYGKGLAGCILSGTGNVPAMLSRGGRSLSRLIAAVKGEKSRSKLIDGMGAGAYSKQIENARTPFDWLSTDDSVVDAYISDERSGFMFTVGGYATLLDLTAEIATPKCASMVPKDLPVLFVAGDKDPVGGNGEGVKAAAKLLKDAGVENVTTILYPSMRHEIHNEVGFEQVYDDIASWIESVLKEGLGIAGC